MFGKIGKIFDIVKGLSKDITDVKALIAAVLAMLADVKAVLAEVKGITSSTPAVAGSVIVPAPPAGQVLVAIPAEHVAALPSALANIVANANPMQGVTLPK
jgi:hypothetical protein